MKEIFYVELPTPDQNSVCVWLQQQWEPELGAKIFTPDGILLQFETSNTSSHNPTTNNAQIPEISIFVWSVQRTTYLKAFRWSDQSLRNEGKILRHLEKSLRNQFPYHYPEPPKIDLSQQSIFEALAPHYPQTVHFFQKMPNGEYDLNRVYWWEKQWRQGVRNPQLPKQVIFETPATLQLLKPPEYDLIYVGGALGVIHAAVMAQLGYRVLLIERLPFGRMNREWNISRDEFQSLIDLGLFTSAEFENLIAREYVDGFNKFFDGNNPPHLRSAVLHTPTVLNICSRF